MTASQVRLVVNSRLCTESKPKIATSRRFGRSACGISRHRAHADARCSGLDGGLRYAERRSRAASGTGSPSSREPGGIKNPQTSHVGCLGLVMKVNRLQPAAGLAITRAIRALGFLDPTRAAPQHTAEFNPGPRLKPPTSTATRAEHLSAQEIPPHGIEH